MKRASAGVGLVAGCRKARVGLVTGYRMVRVELGYTNIEEAHGWAGI